MKITSKIRFFLIVFALFSLSIAPVASAQTVSNAYISAAGAVVTPGGNGVIYVDFTVLATGTMDKVGVSIINIFTTEDDVIGDSDDYIVKTFFYTDSPSITEQMMATDDISLVSYVEYSGVSGQKYYAKMTFYAENKDGFGTMSYTTKIATAK